MRVRPNNQKLKSLFRGVAYLARGALISPGSSSQRVPDLAPLSGAHVAVFGLGCLGAPSAMEFARAGVGRLTLVDHDLVDPATAVRWPRGLAVAGLTKVNVIADWIRQEYPWCTVTPYMHRIGGVRRMLEEEPADEAIVAKSIDGASMIFDASAELGVQHFLTDLARTRGIPYVGVSGTYGGWGGKVIRFGATRPDRGCWWCYRRACLDGTIAEPPSDPTGEVQPRGCADPTFTGSNFDLMQVAMTGVRLAVSTLCGSTKGGYPAMDWDVMHIRLRTDAGAMIVPQFHAVQVPIHPTCDVCNGR